MNVSRKQMIEFLAGHERYDTMNSWNAATSYSRCVKIYKLGLPQNLRLSAYDLLDADETDWRDEVNEVLRQFGDRHGWNWQIYWNGRSSGYLVLYSGKRDASGVVTYCGRGIDQSEDFDTWGTDSLRRRYRLVRDFDRTVDRALRVFVYHCKHYRVEERTVSVSKTIRVAVRKEGGT